MEGSTLLISIGVAALTVASIISPTAHHAPSTCSTVQTLKAAGFEGANLREAWAIVMRESHGHERSISSSHDYGIFQLNKPTWGRQSWWSDKSMLTGIGNAKAAFRISEGGRTWRAWGLTGQGKKHPTAHYPDSVYQAYVRNYRAFPKGCLG